MTLDKLRLTLNPSSDNYQFDLYPIREVPINSRKEAFSIAPPGAAAYENLLLGINGMQSDITIRGFLWDDGTDRANGTAPSSVKVGEDTTGTDVDYTFTNGTVVTVEEQQIYLEHVIHAEDFSAAWTLDETTGGRFNGEEVFVEAVEPTAISRESPKWKPVRIALRRGTSIG